MKDNTIRFSVILGIVVVAITIIVIGRDIDLKSNQMRYQVIQECLKTHTIQECNQIKFRP